MESKCEKGNCGNGGMGYVQKLLMENILSCQTVQIIDPEMEYYGELRNGFEAGKYCIINKLEKDV